MRGQRALKAMFQDPRMKELIECLWREYPGLYNEKYARIPSINSEAPAWLLNSFSEDVQFGQAIGQDHSIIGNQSIAIGIGAIARAFREIVLGCYATEDVFANPTQWVALDRLITGGNGLDAENRSDALILFKSGLLKLFNAIMIGKYDHRTPEGQLVDPISGMLQYDQESGLQVWVVDKWLPLIRAPGIGPRQTGIDAGYFGEVSITDDYEYRCTQEGEAGVAIWKKIVLYHT